MTEDRPAMTEDRPAMTEDRPAMTEDRPAMTEEQRAEAIAAHGRAHDAKVAARLARRLAGDMRKKRRGLKAAIERMTIAARRSI